MSSSVVDKIKEKLDVASVIGAYIKLEKAGSNLKAKCPFHNEKTPSFFVSPSRGSYYCFGCSAKGDIFTFVEEFEGVDFMGALKVLAAKAGVEIVPENHTLKTERERMYSLLDTVTLMYQRNLDSEPQVIEYLKKRGLNDVSIKEWRIGFVPDEWRSAYSYLISKGFTEKEIEKAGIIKRADRETPTGEKFYDRFRSRIMFPIFDSAGRIVAFSGRIWNGDEKAAKYINSPETELFTKSHVLYGFHKAKNHIRIKDYSILVEGQMDLLLTQQAGYTNTVASSGTAFTEDHMAILKRLSNRVILAFDGDKAGNEAASRSAMLALSLGMEVKVAELPEGIDPAELVIKAAQKWADAIKNSKHIVDFQLSKAMKETDDKKIQGDIRLKVFPFLALLESDMEKSRYVVEIAHKIKMQESVIWEELKKFQKKYFEDLKKGEYAVVSVPLAKKAVLKSSSIERKILGIILWQRSLTEPNIDVKNLENRWRESVGKEKFEETIKQAESIAQELIFEAEAYFSQREKLDKDINELFENYEEENLKDLFSKAMGELRVAEANKDAEKALSILKYCQELSGRIARNKK